MERSMIWMNFPKKHAELKCVLIASIVALGLLCLLASQDRANTNTKYVLPQNIVYRATSSGEEVGEETNHLPHALIIGARKCGTGTLIDFLGRHPSIARPLHASHFFSHANIFSNGFDWYHRYNKGRSDQLFVEGTPDYFFTPAVPARIKHMNESIRLLLILRDPVVRLISDYTMVNQSGAPRVAHQYISRRLMLHRDAPVSAGMFPDINSVMLDQNGEVDGTLLAVQIGMYATYLERYLRYFKMEQIHVVDGAKFSKSPWTELSAVEHFLGIEHILTENMFQFNSEKGFYCYNVTDGCMSTLKGVPHPNVDSNVIAKLKEFYRPHNDKLFKILNRKFDW